MRFVQSWVLRFVDVIFCLHRMQCGAVPVGHGLYELHGLRRRNLQQCNGEVNSLLEHVRDWKVICDFDSSILCSRAGTLR